MYLKRLLISAAKTWIVTLLALESATKTLPIELSTGIIAAIAAFAATIKLVWKAADLDVEIRANGYQVNIHRSRKNHRKP